MKVRDLTRGLFLAPLFAALVFASSGAQASAFPNKPRPAPNVPTIQLPEVPAPAVNWPVYQAPAVQAPVYQPPAIQAPQVQAPVFQAPVFQAPAVQAPVNPAPVFRAPEITKPVIDRPAVQAPSFQAPPIQAPAIQAPKFTAPAVQVPALVKPDVQLPAAVNRSSVVLNEAPANPLVNFAPKFPAVAGPNIPAIVDNARSALNFEPRLPEIFTPAATLQNWSKYNAYKHKRSYDFDCRYGYVWSHGTCVPRSVHYQPWYDGCHFHVWYAGRGWTVIADDCYKHYPHKYGHKVYWDPCGCWLYSFKAPSGHWCVGYYDKFDVNVFIVAGYYPTYVQTVEQAVYAQQSGQLILQTPPARIVGGNNPVVLESGFGSTFATAQGPLAGPDAAGLLGGGVAGIGLLMAAAGLTSAMSGRKSRQTAGSRA